MNHRLIGMACAAALCLSPLALAQGRAQTLGADPADTKAPAPPLRYESAFAGYKAWQDTKPGNWRALNDRLAKRPAGAGHSGHAVPAAPSAPSAPVAPAASASLPMAGHGAHHPHGGQP